MNEPARVPSFQQFGRRHAGLGSRTNATNDEDFGRPSITVPSRYFFPARQTSIVSKILWGSAMGFLIKIGIHVMPNGRGAKGVFIIGFDRWCGRQERGFRKGEIGRLGW